MITNIETKIETREEQAKRETGKNQAQENNLHIREK